MMEAWSKVSARMSGGDWTIFLLLVLTIPIWFTFFVIRLGWQVAGDLVLIWKQS